MLPGAPNNPSGGGGVVPMVTLPGGYSLVFDGNTAKTGFGSSLDTSTWQSGYSGDDWNNVTDEEGNVAVSGGTVTLTLSSADSSLSSPVGEGATINSNPTYATPGYTYQYGYREVGFNFGSAASDGGNANANASWQTSAGWPTTGEIDLNETLAPGGYNAQHATCRMSVVDAGGGHTVQDFGSLFGFHRVGMLWTATTVTAALDGDWGDSLTIAVAGPMWLMHTTGANSLGSSAAWWGETVAPASIGISYDRIWQL